MTSCLTHPGGRQTAHRIAFGSNDGFLYLYRVGDTVPKAVFHDESLQVGFPEWSPVGSRLVFSARGRASLSPPNIHLLDLQTGRSTQLTDDDNAVDRFPVWSPSGRWVAFKCQHLDEPDRPSQVYVVEAESGSVVPWLWARFSGLGGVQTPLLCWSRMVKANPLASELFALTILRWPGLTELPSFTEVRFRPMGTGSCA